MQVFPNFQEELLRMDPRITVDKNPNYPQLANVKIDGINVCAIPSGEIKENPDPGYTIQFSNGFVAKHRSRLETIALVKSTIESLNTPDGKEIFYSRE